MKKAWQYLGGVALAVLVILVFASPSGKSIRDRISQKIKHGFVQFENEMEHMANRIAKGPQAW